MSKTAAFFLVIVFLMTLPTVQVKSAPSSPEDSWVSKKPIPSNVSGLAVANGNIYGFARNVTFEYSLSLNDWKTKSPSPLNVSFSAIAAFQNKIYTVGSEEGLIQVYNPAADLWETKTAMPTPRTQLEANVVGEKIYFIGGRTGGQYTTVDLNEVYDPENDSWTTKAPIPYPVVSYASAVADDKIYVIGGQDEYDDRINLDLVQIYDPATDTWNFGSTMPEVVWQAAAGTTSGELAPKRIYLIGGLPETSIIGTNLNQVYNPETDSWTVGKPMPTSRFRLHVVVVNDKLYAMCGTPYFNLEGVWSSENEEYTPIGYRSAEPSPSPEPTPKQEPFPTTLVIASVVTVTTIGAGLLVYFKKRKH
jgi:hypothetical protein